MYGNQYAWDNANPYDDEPESQDSENDDEEEE